MLLAQYTYLKVLFQLVLKSIELIVLHLSSMERTSVSEHQKENLDLRWWILLLLTSICM